MVSSPASRTSHETSTLGQNLFPPPIKFTNSHCAHSCVAPTAACRVITHGLFITQSKSFITDFMGEQMRRQAHVTLSHTGGLRRATSCTPTINHYTSCYTPKSQPDPTIHYPHISVHYLGQQSEHRRLLEKSTESAPSHLSICGTQQGPPAIPSNPAQYICSILPFLPNIHTASTIGV